MSAEWVIVLINLGAKHGMSPESVTVYGPMTEEEATRLGELYRDAYPESMNLLVSLQSVNDALFNLPTKGKQ